ncbi:NlpC/P60 family protein [Streptomyces sp. NPDC007905]|uniref:NlpC/P60 family protein n=1 Tax=Streptomyces sp. NPDC007905 TaxID=3364788 RepID=UPI0036F0407C
MAPESRDEVRQRIDSLYEQAENATGNYNATRALSAATRSRGVPLAKRSGRRPDPDLDAVARQWFDGARAKLGPTVPAVLPADRQPARPAAPARSRDRAAGGAGEALGIGLGLPELPPGSDRPADRGAAELTAGTSAGPSGRPRAALEAGIAALPSGLSAEVPSRALELPGPGTPGPTRWDTTESPGRALPEATGQGPAAQLAGGLPQLTRPGATDPRGLGMPDPTAAPLVGGVAQLSGPGPAGSPGLPGPGGRGPVETAVLPVAALPAAQGAPVLEPRELPFSAATPRRPSPADFKANNRRKLATARDLLSRYTARLGTPPAAVPAAPGAWNTGARPASQPGLEQMGQWALEGTGRLSPAEWEQPGQPVTGQWQQPQWTTPGTPATPDTALPLTTPTPATPTADTGSFAPLTANPPTSTGSFALLTDTGSFAQPSVPPLTDTGSFAPLTTNPLTDTGSFAQSAVSSLTGTGSFAPLTDTGSLAQPSVPPLTDTGAYTPLTTNPLTDTGSFAHLTAAAAAESRFTPPTAAAAADTGSFAPLTAPVLGSAPQSSHVVRVAKAIAFARAQIGKPCVWGATGPDSYDCSSLTQAAWKAAGVTLPRAAHQQALAGTPVTLAGLEPGDLVLFFDDDRHVGLHIGDGMMVHAPGPGSYIREESIYGAGESAIHRVIRPA